MIIRKATLKDAQSIIEIQAHCFPKDESCSPQKMKKRIKSFPFFYVLEENNQIISYLAAFFSPVPGIKFSSLNQIKSLPETSEYVILLSLATNKPHQKMKYGQQILLYFLLKMSKSNNKVYVVCKKEMIPFYEKYHFSYRGIKHNSFPNKVWYELEWNGKEEHL